MPNDTDTVPQLDSHSRHAAENPPGLGVRLRALWNRARLDEALARGADPGTTADLRLRAAQLRSRRVRARLATSLFEEISEAQQPTLDPITARGWRHRAAVEESRDDLLALILRLRSKRPIDARGAAMAAQLVRARVGRRHQHDGQGLRHAVRAALFALCGRHSWGHGSVPNAYRAPLGQRGRAGTMLVYPLSEAGWPAPLGAATPAHQRSRP